MRCPYTGSVFSECRYLPSIAGIVLVSCFGDAVVPMALRCRVVEPHVMPVGAGRSAESSIDISPRFC